MPLPGVTIDEERIVSSTGALDLDECRSTCWSWAPAISGSRWARCGGGSAAKVTVVEFLDRVTPGMDGEVSREFQRS